VADRVVGGSGRGRVVPGEAAATLTELSRYLFLAGSIPFLVLGAAHALATPHTPADARGLSPADPQLAATMSRTPLRLTRRTDMWRCWVGFNLSHSLGIVLFGAVVVITGRSEETLLREGRTLAPLAVVVATGYLVLAAKYWFRTPIAGCAMGAALFLASWILLLLA
jgi:hypothetical protein